MDMLGTGCPYNRSTSCGHVYGTSCGHMHGTTSCGHRHLPPSSSLKLAAGGNDRIRCSNLNL